MRRRRALTLLRWLPLGVVGTLLVFGSLYPLDFDFDLPRYERNHAERTAEGTLRLGSTNRAITAGPAEWLPAAIEASRVTVEVEAWAEGASQAGPARILTVSASDVTRNLTLGQQGDALVVRVLRQGSDTNGEPALEAPGVFAEPGWRRITVDVSASAVVVTVDGQPAASEGLSGDPFPLWNPEQRLALGDEVTGGRAWRGEIREARVSVPGLSVDYLESGRLSMPARSWYIPPRMRDFFAAYPWRDVIALLDHATAFAILGGAAALAVPRRRYVLGAAVVLGVAVLVEAGQSVSIGRHALFADLVANSVGGMLGLALGWSVLHLAMRPASPRRATARSGSGSAAQPASGRPRPPARARRPSAPR